MSNTNRNRWRWVTLCFGLLAAGPTLADLADVYLKNGLMLRGDVTQTDEEVVLKNAAGEVRIARAEIERIVAVGPAASQPASQPAAAPAPDEEPADEAEEAGPPPEPGAVRLAPAPVVSRRDIQLLRMQELPLEGPAEAVRLRFEKKRHTPDLPDVVLDELRKRPDYDARWADVLLHGEPYEQLQLILRLTGTQYADRITILDDPEVFARFRRQVLPLVNKGCARVGCHTGAAAQVFRFPAAPKTSDAYAYTCFVLLDQMRTSQGPLIDRDNPELSLLLHFLLPPSATERPHPPMASGPPFKEVVRGPEDAQYQAVLEWIRYLLVPHTDYGLEYKNPYAGQVGRPATGSAPAPASAPSATQPAESAGAP